MFFYVQKYIFENPWGSPILLEGASDLTSYILALRLANEMNKEAGGYERYIVFHSEIKPSTKEIVKVKSGDIEFFVKHD